MICTNTALTNGFSGQKCWTAQFKNEIIHVNCLNPMYFTFWKVAHMDKADLSNKIW